MGAFLAALVAVLLFILRVIGIRRSRPYGDSHGSLSGTPLDASRSVPAGTRTGQ